MRMMCNVTHSIWEIIKIILHLIFHLSSYSGWVNPPLDLWDPHMGLVNVMVNLQKGWM
jgi:hypothetical protein